VVCHLDPHALNDLFCGYSIGTRHQARELFAAQATPNVRMASAPLAEITEYSKYLVSNLVSVRVIDLFKMINVDLYSS
jgi:hypothetical protein